MSHDSGPTEPVPDGSSYPQQGGRPQPGGPPYPPGQQHSPGQQPGPPPGPGQYWSPGPSGPSPVGPRPGGAPLSPADERLWATLAHIAVPFVGFIGPLIIWAVFKERSVWLKESTVEALNFSILYTIAQFVSIILVAIVIGMVLLPLIAIAGLILCILAAMAANRGEQYRYPFNVRLVK